MVVCVGLLWVRVVANSLGLPHEPLLIGWTHWIHLQKYFYILTSLKLAILKSVVYIYCLKIAISCLILAKFCLDLN